MSERLRRHTRRSQRIRLGQVDRSIVEADLPDMDDITIHARWDGDASVWLATSEDVPGLVIEAGTWPAMIEETRVVLPELLALAGRSSGKLSLTFRAEERLDLAGV